MNQNKLQASPGEKRAGSGTLASAAVRRELELWVLPYSDLGGIFKTVLTMTFEFRIIFWKRSSDRWSSTGESDLGLGIDSHLWVCDPQRS